MSEVVIKIEKRGEIRGSIGWLAKNAAMIRLGQTKNNEPGAWLIDHNGKTIDTLIVITDDFGECCLVNHDQPESEDFPRGHPYTDAAWVIIEKLIAIASEQLREPEALAKAFAVSVAPKDLMLAAMLKAVTDDPSQYPVLLDFLANKDF